MPPNRKASWELRCWLSDNVRRLRKGRGYTQRELAKLCGLSMTYVSNVEQATLNIILASLQTLACGLGCTEAELLTRPRVDRTVSDLSGP